MRIPFFVVCMCLIYTEESGCTLQEESLCVSVFEWYIVSKMSVSMWHLPRVYTIHDIIASGRTEPSSIKGVGWLAQSFLPLQQDIWPEGKRD